MNINKEHLLMAADEKREITPAKSKMDVITALLTRRSYRKFIPNKEIPEDLLDTMLLAGSKAPSAKNRKPCHFVVIKDKMKLQKLAMFYENAHMLPNASLAILVCADQSLEERDGFRQQDGSAAIENILLAAHGLELGAVWCGVLKEMSWYSLITTMFLLPENIVPIGMIAIGYPLGEKKESNQEVKVKTIHHDKW